MDSTVRFLNSEHTINTCLDLALLCHPPIAFLTIQRSKMHSTTSRWQYILFSFLAILAIRCATAADSTVTTEDLSLLCTSHDQPNPIATTYPKNATGVLNGTISVIPIPMDQARKMIPSQYGILEHAIKDQLPYFPDGMYPVIIQAMHDHDISAMGFNVPDFTRAGVEFPFVDLLGDNSSSFKWIPTLLVTATNLIAVGGSVAYGTTTPPSTFEPSCDAYEAAPGAQPGTSSFHANAVIPGQGSVTVQVSSTSDAPYPVDFFKNITNQPIFGDGKSCDQQIRLFNTKVTTSPFQIENVKGSVDVTLAPFDGAQQFNDVSGVRFASAFIENNYLPCEQFRGYTGAHIE